MATDHRFPTDFYPDAVTPGSVQNACTPKQAWAAHKAIAEDHDDLRGWFDADMDIMIRHQKIRVIIFEDGVMVSDERVFPPVDDPGKIPYIYGRCGTIMVVHEAKEAREKRRQSRETQDE